MRAVSGRKFRRRVNCVLYCRKFALVTVMGFYLQLITYNLQLTTCNFQLATYKLKLTTCNLQLRKLRFRLHRQGPIPIKIPIFSTPPGASPWRCPESSEGPGGVVAELSGNARPRRAWPEGKAIAARAIPDNRAYAGALFIIKPLFF